MFKSVLLTIIFALLGIIVWQASLLVKPLSFDSGKPETTLNSPSRLSTFDEQASNKNTVTTSSHSRDPIELLNNGDYEEAISEFDFQYASMSSEQVEDLEQRIFQTALNDLNQQRSDRAITLLNRFNESFQHPQAWYILGVAYSGTNQLDQAVESFLQSAMIEHQPNRLKQVMQALSTSAKQWQNELQQQDDWQAINDLYSNLYHQFPNESRFQFELAQSYLALDDAEQAINLLTQLQYDPQLGNTATRLLAEIEKRRTPEPSITKPQKKDNALIVPLIRAGSSFFIKVKVNRRPLTLLLDTGASITALSPNVIRRLNLKPNGQRIRLSTANGIRQSELYTAKEIQLGKARVKSLPVAEVDLGRNSSIDGLLGTDILNQFNYVIDNQQSALVLRRL